MINSSQMDSERKDSLQGTDLHLGFTHDMLLKSASQRKETLENITVHHVSLRYQPATAILLR